MCKIMEDYGDKRFTQGHEEATERINRLNSRLIADNRIADLQRSTSDISYQKKLLADFGI